MKNVLIISTSLRPNSNSQALGDQFAKGAREAGHRVEQVSLRGKDIRFCQGCLACQSLGRCVIKDDSHDIVQKMHDADVIVSATPIYYYEMAGQMKTLLDRANWLYSSDYRFGDIYLLTSAAEDDPETPEGAEHGLNGWIACFERARLAGTVFAGGVNGAGEIAGHKALQEAYEMGKKV